MAKRNLRIPTVPRIRRFKARVHIAREDHNDGNDCYNCHQPIMAGEEYTAEWRIEEQWCGKKLVSTEFVCCRSHTHCDEPDDPFDGHKESEDDFDSEETDATCVA